MQPDQLRMMLQALLADRFKLVFHRDTKELPVYALVVGKNGPKLQPSEAKGEGPGQRMMRMGRGQLTAQGVAMDAFASTLAQQLGRTVIDKTGLTGKYDFDVEFDLSQPAAPGDNANRPNPNGTFAPCMSCVIQSALQQDLGLRFVKSTVPLDVIVVDHMDKQPTEN